MSVRQDLSPSRKPVDQEEDGFVEKAGEAFFEDRCCVFCGCYAYGERPDGSGNLVHDSVIYRRPDGNRVLVALHCVACRPGQVSVCWKRKSWDEISGELVEEDRPALALNSHPSLESSA